MSHPTLTTNADMVGTPHMDKPSLMTLPTELRIRILSFLFSDRVHLQGPGVSPSGATLGAGKPLHIAPLLVSKQFRKECIVEYLRNSTLYIDHEYDLFWAQRELKTLFQPAIVLSEHVRRVEFRMRGREDALRYIEFLGTCSNVKDVTLAIDARLPRPAHLISWTFHLHLLEDHLKGLEAFDLYSVANPENPAIQELLDSFRQQVLASKSV